MSEVDFAPRYRIALEDAEVSSVNVEAEGDDVGVRAQDAGVRRGVGCVWRGRKEVFVPLLTTHLTNGIVPMR